MSALYSSKKTGAFESQLSAGIVSESIRRKFLEQAFAVNQIHQTALTETQIANQSFADAMKHIEHVASFIGDPSHILGTNKTKHGEIAEQLEVGIQNAWRVVKGYKPFAEIDNIPRLGPVDYTINGVPIQSKFIESCQGTLEHISTHLDKYPGFTTDASCYGFVNRQGVYHVPKDIYNELLSVKNGGSIAGFRSAKVDRIRAMIADLEKKTGKSFEEVVYPSVSKYKEVMLGVVDKTLDRHKSELEGFHQKRLNDISKRENRRLNAAKSITKPSLSEALKNASYSAAFAGFASAGFRAFEKIRGGKSMSLWTASDWREVGYDFAEGSIKGGVSSLGIYGLTKIVGITPTFAGAIVNSSVGITSLALDYRCGKISYSDYTAGACAICVESGLYALGSAIGQTVIPVPVVGAVVGSMATKAALEITKYIAGDAEKNMIQKMELEFNRLESSLNTTESNELSKIERYFDHLGGLIEGAQNADVAVSWLNSVRLCRFVNVPQKDIIESYDQLDDFMLN